MAGPRKLENPDKNTTAAHAWKERSNSIIKHI